MFAEKTLLTKDGIELYYYVWSPSGPAKAMIELVHGMAEHPQRYDAFASFLNQNGYLVYAPAHRGHGMTGKKMGQLGHFASAKGWDKVLSDLREIHTLMVRENPLLPCFFFGHSMGSFLTRCYMQEFSQEMLGAVLCGTAAPAGFGEHILFGFIRLLRLWNGGEKKLVFLNTLMNKVQLARIQNPRTPFDWLSRDSAAVDNYIADPHCGFPCSIQFFVDLFSGWLRFSDSSLNCKIQQELPLFFIAGAEDPVGKYGQGVQKSAQVYRALGLKDVRVKLYPEGRHEILNEKIKDDVMATICAWFDEHLLKRGGCQ